MRSDLLDGNFFGDKGYEVVYSNELENHPTEFYALIDEFIGIIDEDAREIKYKNNDNKAKEKIRDLNTKRIEEIEKLIKEDFGEIYFHVVDKIQWGGGREIFVMNYKSKLFTSTFEKFFGYLCELTPNEMISIPSNKRNKWIHNKIVENIPTYVGTGSRKYFITMDCRRWGPEMNYTKWTQFICGMADVLPADFLEKYSFFFNKYYDKKYIFRSSVIKGLRNNGRYQDEGNNFVFDRLIDYTDSNGNKVTRPIIKKEYEHLQKLYYYNKKGKVIFNNNKIVPKDNDKFFVEVKDGSIILHTESDTLAEKKTWSDIIKSLPEHEPTSVDVKIFDETYIVKPFKGSASEFCPEPKDTRQRQIIKSLAVKKSWKQIEFAGLNKSIESVNVPFGFVMGIFNYLSSYYHAITQLHFKHVMQRVKSDVSFNATAHSDDSGARVDCRNDEEGLKVFYLYEIYQRMSQHIISPKKTIFSKIYFEITSILYLADICLPTSQKRLWQLIYQPSAKSFQDDAVRAVALSIDLLSTGCSIQTAYLATLIYNLKLDHIYSSILKHVANRDELPAAMFGEYNELPIYTLLMGSEANTMRHIKYGNIDYSSVCSFLFGNDPYMTGGDSIFKSPSMLRPKQPLKVAEFKQAIGEKLQSNYKDSWTAKNVKFNHSMLDMYWMFNKLDDPSFYSSLNDDSNIHRFRRHFIGIKHQVWKSNFGVVQSAKKMIDLAFAIHFYHKQMEERGEILIENDQLTFDPESWPIISEYIKLNSDYIKRLTLTHKNLYQDCYNFDELFNRFNRPLNFCESPHKLAPIKTQFTKLMTNITLKSRPEALAACIIEPQHEQLIKSMMPVGFVRDLNTLQRYLDPFLVEGNMPTNNQIYNIATVLCGQEFKTSYIYASGCNNVKTPTDYMKYIARNMIKYHDCIELHMTIPLRQLRLKYQDMTGVDVDELINEELIYLKGNLKDHNIVNSRQVVNNNLVTLQVKYSDHVRYMTTNADVSIHPVKSMFIIPYKIKHEIPINQQDIKLSTLHYYVLEQTKVQTGYWIGNGVIEGKDLDNNFKMYITDDALVNLTITEPRNDDELNKLMYYINTISLSDTITRNTDITADPTTLATNKKYVGWSVAKRKFSYDIPSKLFHIYENITIDPELDIKANNIGSVLATRPNEIDTTNISTIRFVAETGFNPAQIFEMESGDTKKQLMQDFGLTCLETTGADAFIDSIDKSRLYAAIYDYSLGIEQVTTKEGLSYKEGPFDSLNYRHQCVTGKISDNNRREISLKRPAYGKTIDLKDNWLLGKVLKAYEAKTGKRYMNNIVPQSLESVWHMKSDPNSIVYYLQDAATRISELTYEKGEIVEINRLVLDAYKVYKETKNISELQQVLLEKGLLPVQNALIRGSSDRVRKAAFDSVRSRSFQNRMSTNIGYILYTYLTNTEKLYKTFGIPVLGIFNKIFRMKEASIAQISASIMYNDDIKSEFFTEISKHQALMMHFLQLVEIPFIDEIKTEEFELLVRSIDWSSGVMGIHDIVQMFKLTLDIRRPKFTEKITWGKGEVFSTVIEDLPVDKWYGTTAFSELSANTSIGETALHNMQKSYNRPVMGSGMFVCFNQDSLPTNDISEKDYLVTIITGYRRHTYNEMRAFYKHFRVFAFKNTEKFSYAESMSPPLHVGLFVMVYSNSSLAIEEVGKKMDLVPIQVPIVNDAFKFYGTLENRSTNKETEERLNEVKEKLVEITEKEGIKMSRESIIETIFNTIEGSPELKKHWVKYSIRQAKLKNRSTGQLRITDEKFDEFIKDILQSYLSSKEFNLEDILKDSIQLAATSFINEQDFIHACTFGNKILIKKREVNPKRLITDPYIRAELNALTNINIDKLTAGFYCMNIHNWLQMTTSLKLLADQAHLKGDKNTVIMIHIFSLILNTVNLTEDINSDNTLHVTMSQLYNLVSSNAKFRKQYALSQFPTPSVFDPGLYKEAG